MRSSARLLRFFFFFLLLCVAGPVACGRTRSGGTSAADGGVASRVVSLAPSTTEALFAIGAGSVVVGRSRFCDYPPEALRLPIVGDVEPDLEAILALHPDLVVGVEEASSARLTARLEARGVRTWFTDAGSFAAIDALLVGLGERVGHLAAARRLASDLDAREGAVTRAVAGAPRPRVLFVASLAPLIAAGPTSFDDALLRAAGARNVLVAGGSWPSIGLETVAELDPDVIVDATDVAGPPGSRLSSSSPGWAGIRAVREGHVVAVHDERILRPGPRVAEGLAALARLLHPEVALP